MIFKILLTQFRVTRSVLYMPKKAGLRDLVTKKDRFCFVFKFKLARENQFVQSKFNNYMVLSINADNCDLDAAPTLVPTTLPFLNIINVGIPRTAYFCGVV